MIEFMQVGAAFLYMFIVFVVSAVGGYFVQKTSEVFHFDCGIPWYYAAYFIALCFCAGGMYLYIIK